MVIDRKPLYRRNGVSTPNREWLGNPTAHCSGLLFPWLLTLVNVVEHGFVFVYLQEILKLSVQDDGDVHT